MVIPRFVDQALRGGPIVVYGDGEQTRCFSHVLDIVAALYDLIRLPRLNGEIVNLGSHERVSIRQLAEEIRARVNPAIDIQHVSYESVFGPTFEDMHDREPDLSRARKLIGYAPRFNLARILDDVIGDRQDRATERHGAMDQPAVH